MSSCSPQPLFPDALPLAVGRGRRICQKLAAAAAATAAVSAAAPAAAAAAAVAPAVPAVPLLLAASSSPRIPPKNCLTLLLKT